MKKVTGASLKLGAYFLMKSLVFLLKVFSGLVIGLTFALTGRELLGYGNLSFSFVVITALMAFMHISRRWGLGFLLIFDGLCVLAALLLKMYIVIAPGA